MAIIPVRRGPGGLEALVNSTWHPVNQAWVDARVADGHDVQMEGPHPATSVQGGVNPRAFAADGASLDAAGSILSQPPRQAVATQQTPNPAIFAPDGVRLDPAGNILPLPGVAAPPRPATDPANPGLTWNPTTGSYNVDPADAWVKATAGAAPLGTTAPTNRQTESLSDYGTLPLPGSLPQDQPAPDPQAREWLERLSLTPGLQNFQAGGRIADYADGGEVPNAVVGEGVEGQADTGAGNAFALEAVWEPTGQPGTYRGYWAEGPVTATLKPGTLIHPIARQHEQLFRDELLPITALKQPIKPGGEGGEALPLPPDPAAYAYGGRVPEPAPAVMTPSLVQPAAMTTAPNQKAAQYNRGW